MGAELERLTERDLTDPDEEGGITAPAQRLLTDTFDTYTEVGRGFHDVTQRG